jgi:hypothetical protein
LTPTLRPGGSRAARHGSNSFHPPSDESDDRHRSLRCRGDLTSRCPCGHWHGARLDTAARAMCRGPLAGHAVASSARPCRRAATLFEAPCGASLRVPARRLRRADRKDRPSRIRRQRRRTPRWRTIPCGTVAPRPIPLERGGRTIGRLARSRPEPCRSLTAGVSVQLRLPVSHLPGAGDRLSSGHSCGSSTYPQERVFRSFP